MPGVVAPVPPAPTVIGKGEAVTVIPACATNGLAVYGTMGAVVPSLYPPAPAPPPPTRAIYS